MGRLSSGVAAKLAGIPRTVFLSKLAEYDIDTFKLTEEELKRDQLCLRPSVINMLSLWVVLEFFFVSMVTSDIRLIYLP